MRGRGTAALALVAVAACLLSVGFSGASFTYAVRNPQTASAASDFVAPTAAASVIVKGQGGVPGAIHAGGTYYVYASVADSGSPPSGIASVKADVSAITPGTTAATLSAGSYSVRGISYDYRSAQLTAGSGLSAGSHSYALALADAVGNTRSQSFSVAVDNGPFAGSSFATHDAGTAGKPEKGDSVVFAFNKAPDPASIVPGWTGIVSTPVTVSIADNASNDTLSVSGATIGSVGLEGNYVASGKTATFTGSSMSLSGSAVTIVLGTDSSGNAKTETAKNAPVWTPSSSNYDSAGNPCSAAKVTGANVRQF